MIWILLHIIDNLSSESRAPIHSQTGNLPVNARANKCFQHAVLLPQRPFINNVHIILAFRISHDAMTPACPTPATYQY